MSSEADLGWAGGILDGEGSLSAQVMLNKFIRPYIEVTNTDPRMPLFLLQVFDRGKFDIIQPRKSNWQVLYRWRVSKAADVLPVLKEVRPYLVIKGEEADLLINLCQSAGGTDRVTVVHELQEIKKNRAEVAVQALTKQGLLKSVS